MIIIIIIFDIVCIIDDYIDYLLFFFVSRNASLVQDVTRLPLWIHKSQTRL